MVSSSTSFVISALCIMFGTVLSQVPSDVVNFHGSGSSAASNCLWHMVEVMSTQTKIPTWATYRSTGSGPGVTEFIGNITHPDSDFGSSDYPLPKDLFDELQAAGKEMIHLPVVMGSVGVYHSVPIIETRTATAEGEGINVNLTACLVARIYKGEVEDWTDPEIAAINPGMNLPVQLDFYGNPKSDQSYPIKVAYRSLGSGTTNVFTTYLHKACPEHWGSDLVGSSVEWPIAGSENAISVQETAEMLSALASGDGVIGYSNSGVAIDQGLDEVALKMEQTTLKDDFFLTSKNAISKDGVAAAVSSAGIPDSGDVDWSGVDVVNQIEGYIYAWPMVMITYVYVRKDLPSFLPDPRAQSLLVAFLKGLYDPKIMATCEKDFLLLPVKDRAREIGLEAIDLLEVSSDAPTWIIETDTLVGDGMGDYVISTLRARASSIQQHILKEKIAAAELTLDVVLEDLIVMEEKSAEMETTLGRVSGGDSGLADSFDEMRGRINGGFYMAIVSLVLWVLSAGVLFMQQSKIRDLEAKHAKLQTIATKKKRRVSNAVEERPPEEA